jgi:hypothetical protein
MAIQRLQKVEIAKQQLETALWLDSEGQDPLSVITLAGAAEEILGKLLARNKLPNALQVRQQMAKRFLAGKLTEKAIAKFENYARNELKHFNEAAGPWIELDVEEAADNMLDRAIENYFALTQDLTPAMSEWQNRRYT